MKIKVELDIADNSTPLEMEHALTTCMAWANGYISTAAGKYMLVGQQHSLDIKVGVDSNVTITRVE